MTHGPVVSKAGPLIALQQLGRLDLLRELFTTVLIPPAVARETTPTVAPQPWLVERDISPPLHADIEAATLGAGEAEALALALEVSARWVIVDERRARGLAQNLGLPVIGTLGILLAAKRQGLLREVRPLLADLDLAGFHMSERLREQVLRETGECP